MNSHVLQLLHHRAHATIMLWRWRCLVDIELLMRHDTFDQIQQFHGIVGGPQVEIQSVDLVQVLVLVCETKSWEMPVRVVCWTRRSSAVLDTFDNDGEQIWVLVCVGQHGMIQVCEDQSAKRAEG
jgi:hypothetical protein